MSSDTDPILKFTRRSRLTQAVAGTAVIAAGVFALWPANPTSKGIDRPDQNPKSLVVESEDSSGMRVSRSDFDLTLWNEPQVVVRDPEPVARPAAPPMKLELLAIISTPSENGSVPVYSAAVFDPEAFEVRIVSVGDEIGGYEVQLVSERRIELERLGRIHELAMEAWGEVEFP